MARPHHGLRALPRPQIRSRYPARDHYRLYAFFNNVPEMGEDGRVANAVPMDSRADGRTTARAGAKPRVRYLIVDAAIAGARPLVVLECGTGERSRARFP